MKSNPFAGITRPSLPILSDIERRMAELTGVHQQLVPQAQLQTRPTPPTPPPPSPSPDPILGDAALYGAAGLAVCGLAPPLSATPGAERPAGQESHDELTFQEADNEESMQEQT